MDMSAGIFACAVVGCVAGAYIWKATGPSSKEALAKYPSFMLLPLVLLYCRVKLVMNVWGACVHVGVWLLMIGAGLESSVDLSSYIDHPESGPLCILYAVLHWLPIRGLAVSSTPNKKCPK